MGEPPGVVFCCSRLSALRYTLLYTLVVISSYFSYCCFRIWSKQSEHSPLTCGLNKAFSPKDIHGIFSLFGVILFKPYKLLSSVPSPYCFAFCFLFILTCNRLRQIAAAPSALFRWKFLRWLLLWLFCQNFSLKWIVRTTVSHKWHFLSHSDAQFDLHQVVLTMSNALSCCHVTGRINICVNEQLK